MYDFFCLILIAATLTVEMSLLIDGLSVEVAERTVIYESEHFLLLFALLGIEIILRRIVLLLVSG